ncbi:hypothetical protein CKW48_20885, partial [Bordetella pertussis]
NNVGHGPPGFLDAGVRPMALITSCLPAPVGGTAIQMSLALSLSLRFPLAGRTTGSPTAAGQASAANAQ